MPDLSDLYRIATRLPARILEGDFGSIPDGMLPDLSDLYRQATGLPGKIMEAADPERVTAEVEKQVFNTRVFLNTGFLTPMRPDKIARALLLLQRWGNTPAGAVAVSALRFPDEVAIIDDLGTVTFDELHRRTNVLAHGFSQRGIGAKDNVGVMCRNHRFFIETTVALSKLGANTLYLNTAFAGPQIAEVAKREKATAVVYDSEFDGLMSGAKRGRGVFIAWRGGTRLRGKTLEKLIEDGDESDLSAPAGPGRVVIPDVRDHRYSQRRGPGPAQEPRPRGLAALGDPAQGPGEDADRGAALPLLGLRPLQPRAPARRRTSCSASSTPSRRWPRSRSISRRRCRWCR